MIMRHSKKRGDQSKIRTTKHLKMMKEDKETNTCDEDDDGEDDDDDEKTTSRKKNEDFVDTKEF
jgi:hypothetical protein